MNQYHKIKNLFQRDSKGKLLYNNYSCLEFEILKFCQWILEEKIDGTNIRVQFKNNKFTYKGKTDKAIIPNLLLKKLRSIFEPLKEKISDIFKGDVCFYGEGFGNGIQALGKKYIKNDVDFILFDIKHECKFIHRTDLNDVALILGLRKVPLIKYLKSLDYAINLVKKGFNSKFGDFKAESLICRPACDLYDRKGKRIIVKLKHKDYKDLDIS